MQFGLKTLDLENFCQHRSLHWDFRPGLLGIYGPNGTGKSNAINLGAYAAFTNDYSRHPGGKAGCICQQLEEGESSKIQLVCTSEVGEFTLRRGLLNPEEHFLRLGDNKPLVKDGKIQDCLEKTLGIKKSVLDEYVFIAQGTLFDFISVREAERIKSFARLCGTEHSEACWTLLGNAITKDAPLAAQLIDNSDELRQKLGEYRKRVRILLLRLRKAKMGLLSKEQRQLQQTILDKWSEATRLRKEIDALGDEEVQLKKEAIAANTQRKKDQQKYEAYQKEIGALTTSLGTWQTTLATYEERKKAADRKTELETERDELTDKDYDEPKEPCKKTAFELSEECAKLTSERNRLEELLETVSEDTVKCPLCGTKTTSLAERVKEANKRLPEIKAKIANSNKLIWNRKKYEEDLAELKQLQAVDAARLKQVLHDLKGLKDAKPLTAAEKDAAKTADEMERKLAWRQKGMGEAESEARRSARACDQAVATHRAKRKQIRDDELALAEIEGHVSKEEAQQAFDALNQHREVELHVTELRAKLQEAKDTVLTTETELENLETVLSRSKAANQWLALNNRAREILHRDNLPAKVHQARLEEMEEQLNIDLHDFSSPFRVVAEEGLLLTAHFRNGTIMPAAGLSGGEKMMLALCYRLAVNPGLMVLDEPTDGLDRENRALAADVLVRLGDIAKQRGHQIICITHDDVLRRAFDQIIELEKHI